MSFVAIPAVLETGSRTNTKGSAQVGVSPVGSRTLVTCGAAVTGLGVYLVLVAVYETVVAGSPPVIVPEGLPGIATPFPSAQLTV